MEVLEVLGGSTIIGMSPPLDAGHHLGDEDEIDDQWRSKQRIFADVEETRLVGTSIKLRMWRQLTRLSGDLP